jgi:catechol 2,3-dioxygenase-like lactoylglutathione lyase family enzyme
VNFDRRAEDVGNIVQLEHLNLAVPDQLLATRFYVTALGLTRDPYLVTGVDNMWVNAERTQFHLPHGPAQRLRGVVKLVIPGRRALLDRLRSAADPLRETEFGFEEGQGDCVEVRCPWGNRFQCFEPDSERSGGVQLGIFELAFMVPANCAEAIAHFYREVFGADAQASDGVARVRVGRSQTLSFSETHQALTPYDGHHIQVHVADFSGPHRRLKDLGLVTEESSQYQFRFLDLVDPHSGTSCFRLEHEVRSITHPLYGRPLINRNPQQNVRDYRPGADAFVA